MSLSSSWDPGIITSSADFPTDHDTLGIICVEHYFLVVVLVALRCPAVVVMCSTCSLQKNSKMNNELYDVILKVPSNGIHSPWNLHAFVVTRNIFPINCSMCSQTIYPFLISARCVRCDCCVHRSCTRKDNLICQKFLLGPMGGISLNWGVTGSILESGNEKSTTRHGTKQVIQVASPIVKSTTYLMSKIGLLPSGPFPKTGSEECLWRKALRQIASEFNLIRIGSIPNHNPSIIAKITQSLLRDQNSFPGRVAIELRNLFLSLSFQSDRDQLIHGREMLDNISCSIFILLPSDINQNSYLRLVITIVDWFILREHDGSVYDLLWNASHRITETMDQILINKLIENRELYDQLPSNLPMFEEMEMKLSRIPCEYSPMDKLKRLVQVLKYLSSATGPDAGVVGELSQDGGEQFLHQDLNVDADLLMKRFIDLIAYYTIKYEIYWYAECIFIEFLCTESSWKNDADGYAFVSLQQALRSLCPNAAILSAAQSNVEICVEDVQEMTVSQEESSDRALLMTIVPINSE
jgi:hypothetical protein